MLQHKDPTSEFMGTLSVAAVASEACIGNNH